MFSNSEKEYQITMNILFSRKISMATKERTSEPRKEIKRHAAPTSKPRTKAPKPASKPKK
jgi:hypothetical protein